MAKRKSSTHYSNDKYISRPQRWLLLSARTPKNKEGLSSSYRGVSIYRTRGRIQWRAGLTYQGRKYFLGAFDSQDEAAFAWNEAALRIIGPLAEQRLNTICSPLPLNNDSD